MNNKLILEDINRIGFLMNYNIENLSNDQIISSIDHEDVFDYHIVSEQKPQQKLTPEQINSAKYKVQEKAKKDAEIIFKELKTAMDMDGDNVLNDYDGTNEGGVVAAIKKIKNKEILDYLNQRVKKTKQYNSLKSWINAELSDFDSEYGAIWKKLESLGYDGANYNILLKVAGYTPIGLIVKGADKAIDALRSMSLEDIMEGFRGIIGGTLGAVASIILSVTGPIGAGLNIIIYGILTAWDIYQASIKSAKFTIFNLILDLMSLVLSAIGMSTAMKPLAGAKASFAGAKGTPGFFKILAQKFPNMYKMLSSVTGGIATAGSSVLGYINKGLSWLIGKLPFLKKFLALLQGGLSKIKGFLDDIVNSIKGVDKVKNVGVKTVTSTVSKNALTKFPELLGQTYIKNWGKVQGDKIIKYLAKESVAKILLGLDDLIVKKIKEYLFKYGTSTVESYRPKICAMGKPYCDTFDVMLNAVVVANAVVKGKIDTKDKGRLETYATVTQSLTDKTNNAINAYKTKEDFLTATPITKNSNPVNSPKKTNSIGNA